MTTSNYSVGNLNTYGIASAKIWAGTDGKYTAPTKPRQLKWNAYDMRHRSERIDGAKVPGASGWLTARVVNSAGAILLLDCTGSYVSWLNDGNNPYWTAATASTKFNKYWTSRDETKLLAKLLSKSKGGTSFNVGVSLAEVDKFASSTVGLIKNVSFGAVDLATGRFENFARRFGASPPVPGRMRKLNFMDPYSRFLEMSYCWQPAYNDLFAAAEAFEEVSKGPRKKIFEASRLVHATEIDPSTFKFPDRKIEVIRRYTYEMYEEMSIFRQMGLGNPASILWERIPGSFVLDWFIPIGTYLELVGQVPFMKGRFMRSSIVRQTVNGPIRGKYDATVRSTQFSGPVHNANCWYNRTILASLSVPRPDFRCEGSVQGRRVDNAVALGSLIFHRAMNSYLGNAGKRPKSGVNPNLNSDYDIVRWSKSLLLV